MKTQTLPAIIERRRLPSPSVTPQALAWHDGMLWIGSRDLRRIYAIEVTTWTLTQEMEAPGIPWAAVSAGADLWFTIGEGAEDDRYLRRYAPSSGFAGTERISCPEFTGSYVSSDGGHLYLSQWYKHRILKLDSTGNILRIIAVGAEICGHVFVDGWIYVLHGTEQGNEDWRIARLDPRQTTPEIEDLARVPLQCRSLAFDGKKFWTNHRAANETVSFDLPA
jgi:outer membrane protein assembly factor BamB